MDKLRNKETGVELEGKLKGLDYASVFVFQIAGTRGHNYFLESEWEVVTPRLPTEPGLYVHRFHEGSLLYAKIFGLSANGAWTVVSDGNRAVTDHEFEILLSLHERGQLARLVVAA